MSADNKKLKLTTGTSIKQYLTRVIDEGVKSALAQRTITEKDKQAATGSSPQGGDESSEGGEDELFGGMEDDDADTTSKTMDDETEKLKGGDVDPKDVVDKLNAIRSGKSFKDSAVKGPMEEYITSLSKAERVALFAYLKGIAAIVTGEVSADQATEPHDKPADVKMSKGGEGDGTTKHIQPNVIKGPSQGKKKQKSVEDTTAPSAAPITPKRR